MLPHANFDGFIRGKGALYTNFWHDRRQDLQKYTISKYDALIGYLDEQVFGLQGDDDEAEYERQMAFSRAKWQELDESAANKEDEDEDDQDDGSGDKRDDGQGTSQGK